MKLLIITIIEEFEAEVLKLLKKADIENFSSSDIEGFKGKDTLAIATSWFPGEKSSTRSIMLFSFTTEENIDQLFPLIEEFNGGLEYPNPVRAVVVPIERSI
jgi:hypothetical protein